MKIIMIKIFLIFLISFFYSKSFAQDGQLDKSFNSTGIITTSLTDASGIGMSGTSYSTLIQKDGKIVAVGTMRDGSQSFFCLMRYNQNGKIDSSFGINGIDTTAIGYSDDEAFCGLLQPDGKIIAGGFSSLGGAGSQRVFALIRYNTNGSIDNTFGNNGIVKTSINNSDDEIKSLAIQSDGKILAAGFSIGAISNLSVYDFALVRYNIDGSIDGTFGQNGTVTTSLTVSGKIQYYNIANSVLIQSDGKILIGGYTGDYVTQKYYFALLRFNADGSPDNLFGNNGISLAAEGDTDEEITSIALQKDNKIVAGGFSLNTYLNGEENDFTLMRFNQNGSIDNSFGSGGVSITSIGHNNDVINSILVQSDDKIVAAGSSYLQSETLFALARFNSNGSLDNTFGTNGIVTTVVGPFNSGGDDKAYSAVIQNDGKIVVSGTSMYNNFYNLYSFAVVRYNGSVSTGIKNSSESGIPQAFMLYQNYPNPFNPSTTIQYSIPNDGNVKVIIYDLMGNKIDILLNRHQAAGEYKVSWNGINESGQAVSSGVYLYSLEAGNYKLIRKMIFLK